MTLLRGKGHTNLLGVRHWASPSVSVTSTRGQIPTFHGDSLTITKSEAASDPVTYFQILAGRPGLPLLYARVHPFTCSYTTLRDRARAPVDLFWLEQRTFTAHK